ncbi:MAG: dynamin [Nitrospirae bacterium]|nr:MAG: dynamin [Nitrospirota bacterium]
MKATFEQLKRQLLQAIDEAATLDEVSGCPCDELREKLIKNRFNLVVVGQFKRGKTTFINSLLGADVLPTAVVPLTSIVTVIEYGNVPEVKVFYNDGREDEVPLQALWEYVTEKGNPKNEKDVAEVVLRYPSGYLKDGLRLIDTPGVGSVYQHNTDVAYEYLPRADAAVFLLSVDQPLSKAEVDFLRDVHQFSDRIFFLLNKADYLSEEDLRESLDFSIKTLKEEAGYPEPEIYPVSAKLALEGKTKKDDTLVKKSRMEEFEQRLRRFLLEEKGKVLLRSVARNLMRVLSEAALKTELQLKGLQSPVEQMQEKLRTFEEKLSEIETEKRDFEVLLEGEVKRIINEILDPDLEKAKAELTETLIPQFEQHYHKNRHLSASRLRKSLEEFITSEVKQYYSIFRKNEDTKISLAFEQVAQRFIKKIEAIVDELLRFSSELFEVPFERYSGEALWSMESSFYFKFKDEPLMIEMLGEALTSFLPKFLSHRIVYRAMRTYLLEMVERQSGRIRWDFVDRLQRSRREFRFQMLQKIADTVEGIRQAIEKGIKLKQLNEEEAEGKKAHLEGELRSLSSLKVQLEEIIKHTEQ